MINRRRLLSASAAVFTSAALAPHVRGGDEPRRDRLDACVIGHTGKGDYGHGMDVALASRSDVEILAVADPVAEGRSKAAERAGAKRQYADYREMLAKERPALVIVGPRQTGEHREMLLAALRAGAHVYSEKPFVSFPAEADEVLGLAKEKKLKIAVAHQLRLAPSIRELKRRIDREALIGDLLEINAWGKQDPRAGGEDLMVLGVHLFDLMRLFAGDPTWCTARVLQKGRDIAREDAHVTNDYVGPVAGDEVMAQFAFEKGVQATMTSRGRLRDHTGQWGIELVGSKGAARIVLANIHPPVYVQQYGKWNDEGRTEEWKRMPGDPSIGLSGEEVSVGPGNKRIVDDWLAAIRGDREPEASGANAAWAVEMVMGVYWAALSGARATFPLKDRGHPLASS